MSQSILGIRNKLHYGRNIPAGIREIGLKICGSIQHTHPAFSWAHGCSLLLSLTLRSSGLAPHLHCPACSLANASLVLHGTVAHRPSDVLRVPPARPLSPLVCQQGLSTLTLRIHSLGPKAGGQCPNTKFHHHAPLQKEPWMLFLLWTGAHTRVWGRGVALLQKGGHSAVRRNLKSVGRLPIHSPGTPNVEVQ